MSGRRKKRVAVWIALLAVLLAGLWRLAGDRLSVGQNGSDAPAVSDGSQLTAEFLDVGQGDCSLFILPDGKTLLIDAGNRADGDEIVDYLKGKGIGRIDYLIATHPHADHIGGMSAVIDAFEIGQIFAPKVADEDIPTGKTYQEFLTAVRDKGLKITAARQGMVLFEGNGYRADCLAPCGEGYESLNNYSVVVKLSHGQNSFLMTGDAEQESEAELLAAGGDVDCDVLKVGHHGSSTSTSAAFLKAASPTYAVISCGKDNSYGHPHAETLKALQASEGLERIFRTDTDQTVIMTSDGKNPVRYTVGNPSAVK